LLNSVTLERDDQVPPTLKFEVTSSLGKTIRLSEHYWQKIIETKHPIMAGHDELVRQALTSQNRFAGAEKTLQCICTIAGARAAIVALS
jgi:hypothetical protein